LRACNPDALLSDLLDVERFMQTLAGL